MEDINKNTNIVQEQNVIQLEKAYTFFMMPFYLTAAAVKIVTPLKSNIWKRNRMNVDKGVLYSHIQDFISKSVMEDDNGDLLDDKNLTSYDYHVYSLSPDNDRFEAMLDSNMEHAIIIKNNTNVETGTKQITFRFNNTKSDKPQFFSPKLVICPNAKVGLLMFSVEIIGKKDVETLAQLNYELFKTYKDNSSQSAFVYLPKQLRMRKLEESLDEMRKKIKSKIKIVRELRMKSDSNAKNGSNEGVISKCCNEIKEEYGVYKEKNDYFVRSCREKLKGASGVIGRITDIDRALGRAEKEYGIRELLDHYWTMRQFTESLLSEFEGEYTRADNFRLHVFSYLQVAKESSRSPELLPAFSRIIRCQDQDYLSICTSLGNPVYEQLYENIYVGSTVEGGGVLTFQQGRGDDFMSSFCHGPLTHSYLWIYLLVIMQRHTLLQMSRELAEEYGYSGKDTDEQLKNLRALMIEMSKAKINTYFTDVSDHSHLNALYQFCCTNLAVNRYFTDVDSKLATLKETLEQLHDEKMRIIQQTRLDIEKKEDRRQQNITKWVGVVAVVLTLFSALSDSYDLFSEEKLNWIPRSLPSFELVSFTEFVSSICHLFLLLGAFAIVGTITWLIIDNIQKVNKREDMK